MLSSEASAVDSVGLEDDHANHPRMSPCCLHCTANVGDSACLGNPLFNYKHFSIGLIYAKCLKKNPEFES